MADIVGNTTLRDVWAHLEEKRGEATFLEFEDYLGAACSYTYSVFAKRINQTANLLVEMGVSKGECIGIHLCDTPEYLMMMFGAMNIGAIVVPLSVDSSLSECEYIIDKCEIKYLITQEPEMLEHLLNTASFEMDNVLLFGEADTPKSQGGISFETASKRQSTTLDSEVEIDSEDTAEILFTSGTTSYPKGIMLTHANLIYSGYFGSWQASIGPDDKLISSMHAVHIYLQTQGLFPVLISGATLVYLQKYSARKFWSQVCGYRATHVMGISMIVRTLLLQEEKPWEKENCVKEFIHFLPISDKEKARFESRFGVRILNAYGATETVNAVIADCPGYERRWPSIGKVGLGYEAKLVNKNGEVCKSGETGEIWIKGVPGRTLMKGYWGDQKATDKVLTQDGWYRTSDLGYVTEDGWYYFASRKSEFIKSRGESISPTEVERVILECSGISEAAVIGVPNVICDCDIEAFVCMKAGYTFDEAEIRNFCIQHLAKCKVPLRITELKQFPRSSYGKISKVKLLQDIDRLRSLEYILG